MAQMVTDLIEPQELIDYVRQWDIEVLRPEAQLTLDRWLPNRLTEDLEFRIRRGALNDVDAAEYRAWDVPAPMTGRPGVSRVEGSLGPVSRQIPLGEEEFLRSRALDRGTNDPIIEAIYDDAERMIRAVQVRIELARGDVINDGKVTIAENGLLLEADFGRDPAMVKAAAVVWTDANALILAELLAWQEAYIEHNGTEPGLLLMPKARVGNFALNAEMRSYAAANATTPNRINRQVIDSIFSAEGLPPIETYDTQVRVNGTRVRVLPANKVFFMPSANEPLGHTFYGVTAEALLLRERGLITREAAPGIVATVNRNEHPVQTFTVGTAIALPAIPNPDLILEATVAV